MSDGVLVTYSDRRLKLTTAAAIRIPHYDRDSYRSYAQNTGKNQHQEIQHDLNEVNNCLCNFIG